MCEFILTLELSLCTISVQRRYTGASVQYRTGYQAQKLQRCTEHKYTVIIALKLSGAVAQVAIPPTGARVLLASDGLWDAVGAKTAAHHVRSLPATKAAAELVRYKALIPKSPER